MAEQARCRAVELMSTLLRTVTNGVTVRGLHVKAGTLVDINYIEPYAERRPSRNSAT